MQKHTWQIGDFVRIAPVYPESHEFHGRTGQLILFDEHATDGDFFGVRFPKLPTVYFFW